MATILMFGYLTVGIVYALAAVRADVRSRRSVYSGMGDGERGLAVLVCVVFWPAMLTVKVVVASMRWIGRHFPTEGGA